MARAKSKYDVDRPKREGHIPLGKEEFDRMLKLAGVSKSDLQTTEGILKARRRVLDTLEAPKGPFVKGAVQDGGRFGEKVRPEVEEVEMVKEAEPKVLHLLRGFLRMFGMEAGGERALGFAPKKRVRSSGYSGVLVEITREESKAKNHVLGIKNLSPEERILSDMGFK